MLWVMFGIIMLFVFTGIGALVYFDRLQKKPKRRQAENIKKVEQNTQNTDNDGGTFRHVKEIFDVEFIDDGIYYTGGHYCMICRLAGTNFSVMSDDDQNTRESVLIDILTNIDYPVQFITTTVVADTAETARDVALRALDMPDGQLKSYAAMYAKTLDEMYKQRLVLTQQSYMVITDDGSEGDPVERLKQKSALLSMSLRQRAGITLTPLTSRAEVVNVFGQLLNPDRLTKPGEILDCINDIHLSHSEVEKFVQEKERKTRERYSVSESTAGC